MPATTIGQLGAEMKAALRLHQRGECPAARRLCPWPHEDLEAGQTRSKARVA